MTVENFFAEASKPRTVELVVDIAEDVQRLAIEPGENEWKAVYYAANPDMCVEDFYATQAEAVHAIRTAVADHQQKKLAQEAPNVLAFKRPEQRYYEPNLWNMRPVLPLEWLPIDWPLNKGEEASRCTNFGPFMLSTKRAGEEVKWSIVSVNPPIDLFGTVQGYRWELGAEAALRELPKAVESYASSLRMNGATTENQSEIDHLMKIARVAADQ